MPQESGITAAASGGGVEVGNGNFGINNVTIAENSAVDGGGMHVQNPSLVTLRNSVLADNPGGNCGGLPVTSLGYNLDTDSSCLMGGPGDLAAMGANLGPLADNGGPTFTHALLPGSPALEAGEDATCEPGDQRGVIRPQGLHYDMGAYEAETPATATPPSVTGTPTPTFTPTGTPTSAMAKFPFDPVEFSSDKLFQGGKSCDPKTLTVKVRATPPAMVSSVGLFYRIVAKQGTQSYPWGGGLAMTPLLSGWYTLPLAGNDLPKIGKWQIEAWPDFQFVANNANNQPIAWSSVYRQVTLWQGYI